MCILASITAALLCWPLLAVLALRRNDRLASHPVLFAKTSHLFLDEYLDAGFGPQARSGDKPDSSFAPYRIHCNKPALAQPPNFLSA